MPTINYFKHDKNFLEFTAGTHIIKADEEGDKMFVVHEGTVEIFYRGKLLDTVEPGGLFGEMALIDQPTRSADAIAKTDCKVIPVDRDRFLFMVQETPTFALQVLQVMAERVRKANEIVQPSSG